MGSLSIWHWLIVLVVVVLVFGTKKLRNVGQDLGGAVKGFKEGMKEASDADDAAQAAAQQVTAEKENVEKAAATTSSTIDVQAKEESQNK